MEPPVRVRWVKGGQPCYECKRGWRRVREGEKGLGGVTANGAPGESEAG